MLHTDVNMQNIAAPGDCKPEQWYQVRVSEVVETDDAGNQLVSTKGGPIIVLKLKIQQPSDMIGQYLFDRPSLQAHALYSLKAYYKAAGYNPGSEGHDPQKLVDTELWVYNENDVYEGVKRDKIPAWSIRSLQDGPGKKK